MRRFIAFVLATCLAAPAASALERAAVRLDGRSMSEDWAVGATCSVSYYNACTGWVWTWSDWQPGDRVGMVFDPCCDGDAAVTLAATNFWVWQAIPGWGYSGIATIHTADEQGCPDQLLASQPVAPRGEDNVLLWGIPVSGPVVLQFEFTFMHEPWFRLASDHPAAGPTGPPACGLCFPPDREVHSFLYLTDSAPPCPGSPLLRGEDACAAEWVRWAAAFQCPVHIEPSTWGSIKALYR